MAKITLPPPGMSHKFLLTSCVKEGETLELLLLNDGFIIFLPTGHFTPDLPYGPVVAGTTYHKAGLSEADIVLGYYAANKMTYPAVISIRKECLDTSGALQ